MVAALCQWHERHAAAVRAIEERFDRGDELASAAHALLETYAVLTRLPAPHRLATADAWAAIKGSFVDGASIVGLTGAGYASVLGRLAAEGIAGGRSYDAVIAESAVRGKATELLTFNPKHFAPPPPGVVVVEPPDAK